MVQATTILTSQRKDRGRENATGRSLAGDDSQNAHQAMSIGDDPAFLQLNRHRG